jgi:hypothetical protein
MTIRRDPSLDTLLDLHGQVLVIDEAGYWVRFVVNRVPVAAEKPHGLDYSLTLYGPDGTRLVGFDNAHQVGDRRRVEQDHRHRLRTVRTYDYRDAAALVADFWAEVEALMHERGVWP